MGYNPAIPQSHAVQPATPAVRYLQDRSPQRFSALQVTSALSLVYPFAPNTAMRYQVQDVRGYVIPTEERYFDLWRDVIHRKDGCYYLFCTQAPPADDRSYRALALLGVGNLLQHPRDPPLAGQRPAYDGADARIYRNPAALPRAFLVDRQQVVDGAKAARDTVTAAGFPARSVAVTEQRIAGIPEGTATSSPGAAQDRRLHGRAGGGRHPVEPPLAAGADRQLVPRLEGEGRRTRCAGGAGRLPDPGGDGAGGRTSRGVPLRAGELASGLDREPARAGGGRGGGRDRLAPPARGTEAPRGDHRYVRGVSAPWMSVVVPAYNEEAGIARVIETLRSRLDALERPYEIIVVDNGSQDRTVEVVEGLADGERVRLLCNEINRGKGFSVRRGMLDARGELRLLCDADCGPSLASLPDMLKAMEHADVVAGSRSADGCAGRPPAAAAAPAGGLAVHRADAHAPARADQGRLLRLQALARQRRRGRLLAPAPDRLGLRR